MIREYFDTFYAYIDHDNKILHDVIKNYDVGKASYNCEKTTDQRNQWTLFTFLTLWLQRRMIFKKNNIFSYPCEVKKHFLADGRMLTDQGGKSYCVF